MTLDNMQVLGLRLLFLITVSDNEKDINRSSVLRGLSSLFYIKFFVTMETIAPTECHIG